MAEKGFLYSVLVSACVIGLTALTAQAADNMQRPILSLVIDDLGYSYQYGRQAIELEGDHTYAVIPGTSYARKLASLATENQKEVILHLPLQASDPGAASEMTALNDSMSENELARNLSTMLAEMPSIKGVNNHMGSHLTQIDYFMRPIMDVIKTYNPELYFLDSRTSADSVAHTTALSAGLRSTKRDVFLDNNHENPESIDLQFQFWLKKAKTQGYAVAIGHPHPNTIEYLRENLPKYQDEFEFVSISKLLETLQKQRQNDQNQPLDGTSLAARNELLN